MECIHVQKKEVGEFFQDEAKSLNTSESKLDKLYTKSGYELVYRTKIEF